METFFKVVPVLAVIALLFAAYLASKVNKQAPGNDRMKEIAGSISEGARAFLMAEYKILIVFVAVLFILIGVGIGNWVTAVCFICVRTTNPYLPFTRYKPLKQCLMHRYFGI